MASNQEYNNGDYADGDGGQQQYYEDGQQAYGDENSESLPDILYLNHYCAHAVPPQDDTEEARAVADTTWEPVRDWMRTHSADEVRAAAEQRDDAGKTALHFSCANAPPPDVIDVFLSIASETVEWPDSFGWLPIHYACAFGAGTQVIKSLAEAFPESKTTVDRKGRTPLHFALGTSTSNSPAIVALLSSTGAAAYADDNGMLVRLCYIISL
jgi:ankyrin repeat protein